MEVQMDEFRRVILEIGECLKEGKVTNRFEILLEQYKKELE